MMKLKKILLLVCVFVYTTCTKKNIKFNKDKWEISEDLGNPSHFRNDMLQDLITNYKLIGINYNKVIELLGNPNFYEGKSFGYDIIVNYGHGIDPVYVKSLNFLMTNDSIIQSYKINEFKK